MSSTAQVSQRRRLTPLRLAAILVGLMLAASIGIAVDAKSPNKPSQATQQHGKSASGPTKVSGGSGPTAGDLKLKSCDGGKCALRFVSQPDTTQTDQAITDAFGSAGSAVQVEIYSPSNGKVVAIDAPVTLSISFGPSATLTGGGPVNAVDGVATFSGLSIDTAGAYKLAASSVAAGTATISSLFLVVDDLASCQNPDCTFTQGGAFTSFITDPVNGTAGATYIGALNLAELSITCDVDPYNYPDDRQPDSVFFHYEDGAVGSEKLVTIVIDKAHVQETPENGAAHYRVCFASPDPFRDIFGNWALEDTSADGPSQYFDATWYVGLLPDCNAAGNVAPCVISWTGTQGGDRIGTFRAPAGDPAFR